MITISKGLTGGYGVLGAVIVHERVASHFEDHALLAGLTHYAHPLGVAAALEAIRVYEDEGLIERADALGSTFAALLDGVRERQPRVLFSRSLGLLGALELDADAAALKKLSAGLAERRIHAHLRTREKTLVLAPPLCIGEDHLTEGVSAVEAAIAAT